MKKISIPLLFAMALLFASCGQKTSDATPNHSTKTDTIVVKESAFVPLHSYEIAYDSPEQDTITTKQLKELTAFFGTFQKDIASDMWINFRAQSSSLSFSHTFPDYAVNMRRIADILHQMEGYFGKGYRVTTELETIRKDAADFGTPAELIIVEFGQSE
jgi:hypothetical protein